MVCGINDVTIQKRLLAEGDALTLEKAFSIAQSMEAAVKDSHGLSVSSESSSHIVKKVYRKPVRNSVSTQQPSVNKPSPCYRCGQTGHSSQACRFKTETCFNCKKMGHIKKVCRSRRLPVKMVSETGTEDNEYSLMMIHSLSSSRPIASGISINRQLSNYYGG